MSHQSLRRRLEALRKALANRPPAPSPSSLSVNEQLSRPDPVRDAGVLVVMKRVREFDRLCTECDPGTRDVSPLEEWAWFLGGLVKELWGTCRCGAELEPYEPEWVRPPSCEPSEREAIDEYRSLVARSVLDRMELERSFLRN